MRRSCWLAFVLLGLGCAHEPVLQRTASGLSWRELAPGTGDRLAPDDMATVTWLATKDDGTVFEDRRATTPPIRMRVAPQVPIWWQEGLQLMQPGGRYYVEVPIALMWPAALQPPALRNCHHVTYEVHLVEALRMPKFARPDPQRLREVAGFPCEVLAAGQGEPPAPDHWCTVQYTCWNENGEIVDATQTVGAPLRTRVDAAAAPFLVAVLARMPKGAHWRCSSPIEAGHARWAAILGAKTTIYWDVEVLAVTPP